MRDDLLLHRRRQAVPDLVGPYGLLSRNVAPWLGDVEHVDPPQQVELVAGDEAGASIRYVERIGCGPKRRWETVVEPAFFES